MVPQFSQYTYIRTETFTFTMTFSNLGLREELEGVLVPLQFPDYSTADMAGTGKSISTFVTAVIR